MTADVQRQALARANTKLVTRLATTGEPQQAGESIQKTIHDSRFSAPADHRSLYAKADVPQRHRKPISEQESPETWKTARDQVVGKVGGGFLIALLGNRGSGKTQIAQQGVTFATGLGRSALYVRAMTIFLELRATYSSPDRTELEVIQKYTAPQLLVIDEIQERGETDFENRILNHLLDTRYGDMTDTLVIGNLQPKAFQNSMGSSISDRLRETGGVIECNWKSFRRPANSPGG